MTRSLTQLGALLITIAAPLYALAAADPARNEQSAGTGSAALLDAETALTADQRDGKIVVLDPAGEAREIPADLLADRKGDETTTGCCWVYFQGIWWCIPCY